MGSKCVNFGKELILDIHYCDASLFTRKSIRKYFIKLCDLIDMEREKLMWWDYHNMPLEYAKAPVHLKGISAIQFIKTSNITIHTLDKLKCVYINIFSCKEFDAKKATQFTRKWFKGTILNYQELKRI